MELQRNTNWVLMSLSASVNYGSSKLACRRCFSFPHTQTQPKKEKDACSLSSYNYLALRGTNEDDDDDT